MRPPPGAARPQRAPDFAGAHASGAARFRMGPAQAPFHYVRRLWRGDLPLSRVFWIDMLVVGTLVNIASLIAAIVLLAGAAPTAWGVAVFLVHIPYSMLVVAGVWRSAARARTEWSSPAQVAALAWLVAAFVI